MLIVYCNPKLLLAAEVPLGRLDADVTEQKLDLLQLAAGHVTQTGASPPEIVRCKAAGIGLGSKFFDDAPDDLLRDAVTQTTAAAKITDGRLFRCVNRNVGRNQPKWQ